MLKALAAIAWLAAAAAATQSPNPRRVFVLALDRTGEPIRDLAAGDLTVTEDGVACRVTRATLGSQPPRIVLLIDSSTTMKGMLVQFRNGLRAFLGALPPELEVAIVSTGRQMRIRVSPTSDRTRLRDGAESFSSDEGPNAFLDSLLESDLRLLRTAPSRWPVFVILTTDAGSTLRLPHIEEFNPFVTDLRARGGTAHVILVQGRNTGITSELAQNLARNTGGIHETMVIPTAIARRMQAAAERIADDLRVMSTRYELEYLCSESRGSAAIEVRALRPGATIQLSVFR
jgi:hypothetical protein